MTTEFIPHYVVAADRDTGEWLTPLKHVGVVLKKEWDAKPDTDGIHYDAFERDGVTCALESHWGTK